MSRILLADRSPHAQRMGERILREEGFEVVTVSSGETALVRLDDAEPDLLLVDAGLADVSGVRICAQVKSDGARRIPVVLTVGESEDFDEEAARQCGADEILKKPFEPSVLSAAVRRLLGQDKGKPAQDGASRSLPRRTPPVAIVDPERVRAAVTLALDAAMPAMIDEITERVLVALKPKSESSSKANAR